MKVQSAYLSCRPCRAVLGGWVVLNETAAQFDSQHAPIGSLGAWQMASGIHLHRMQAQTGPQIRTHQKRFSGLSPLAIVLPFR